MILRASAAVRFLLFLLLLGGLLGFLWGHREEYRAELVPPAPRILPAASPTGQAALFWLSEQRAQAEGYMSLRAIADDGRSPEAVREAAGRQAVLLALELSREAQLQAQLAAEGFPGAAVALTATSAEVVVAQPLTADRVARIGTLVARVSGLPLEAIFIRSLAR